MNWVLSLIVEAYFVPFHIAAAILVFGDRMFQNRGEED